MFEEMEDAEKEADAVARFYSSASLYYQKEMQQIFTKYAEKFGLSRREAVMLLSKLKDKIREYIFPYKDSDKNKLKEILIFYENLESDYVVRYVMFYVVSGVTGLSGYVDSFNTQIGSNPTYIFVFFQNLFSAVFGGGYENYVQSHFVLCTQNVAEYKFYSNVYTLIGDVFVNSGYVLSCLYFFVLGIVSNVLYLNSWKSVYLCVAYSFIAACFVLGMFGQYTLFIFFYTVPGLFIAYHFILRKKGCLHEISCDSHWL